MNGALPPRYLQEAGDVAVWRVLEAAVQEVRERATQAYVHGRVNPDVLRDGAALGEADKQLREVLIPRVLAEQARRLPPGVTLPPFAAQVVFSVLRGFAELDPLFLDPQVSEVIVDGPGQEVYVERDGFLENTGLVLNRERIMYLIERIAGERGQPLSEAYPVLEMRLPMARATALHERLTPGGPALVVRLRARRVLERADLIASGTVPEALWDALAATVNGGANILIAGETSSGKTTLLQTLLAGLPAERRIVTIEDPIEVDLPRARMMQLEVRHPNHEGVGGFDQRELVRLSLRLRPDHLIVGEVRDSAAWDMVDAMSLGHRGSLATIHAGTPRQALLRLESLSLRAKDAPPLTEVQRAIAGAVNLVVQMRRIPTDVAGRPVMHRAVTSISEVTGLTEPGEPGGPYRLAPLAMLRHGTLERTGTTLTTALTLLLRDSGVEQPLGDPAAEE